MVESELVLGSTPPGLITHRISETTMCTQSWTEAFYWGCAGWGDEKYQLLDILL